jgi:hypothetical protein
VLVLLHLFYCVFCHSGVLQTDLEEDPLLKAARTCKRLDYRNMKKPALAEDDDDVDKW